MQVGDGDRVKKKKKEYGGRRKKGETKRERTGGIESNWTNSGVGVFAGSSSKDICSAYVRICTYIYGTFGDFARLGVTRTKDEDIKHRVGTRHVVHASIKVHVESHARPARHEPGYGCDPSLEKLGNTPTLG